ncbi:MAG: mechanosensitive ion channel family protein [Gammaproteobacteria bacterium]|nr:mechanosensitive ion channel family protein [Gammaproteobacteria bacterium]
MELTLANIVDWLYQPVVATTFGIVFATLLADFAVRLVLRRLSRRAEQTRTIWDEALVRSVRMPSTLLIWVLGLSYAAEIISWRTESDLESLIDPVRYVTVIVVFVLFLTRFVRECETGFIAKGADVTTATAIGKLVRISVIITGGLTVLQTLGVSISGVLAFGGIGGIAIGFAARDLLANFFGGAMIYLDQPFKVGDWVRLAGSRRGRHCRRYWLASDGDQDIRPAPAVRAECGVRDHCPRKSLTHA